MRKSKLTKIFIGVGFKRCNNLDFIFDNSKKNYSSLSKISSINITVRKNESDKLSLLISIEISSQNSRSYKLLDELRSDHHLLPFP